MGEAADRRWWAELNGVRLAVTDGGWQQAFTVPGAAGTLDYRLSSRRLVVDREGVAWLVALVLAAPAIRRPEIRDHPLGAARLERARKSLMSPDERDERGTDGTAADELGPGAPGSGAPGSAEPGSEERVRRNWVRRNWVQGCHRQSLIAALRNSKRRGWARPVWMTQISAARMTRSAASWMTLSSASWMTRIPAARIPAARMTAARMTRDLDDPDLSDEDLGVAEVDGLDRAWPDFDGPSLDGTEFDEADLDRRGRSAGLSHRPTGRQGSRRSRGAQRLQVEPNEVEAVLEVGAAMPDPEPAPMDSTSGASRSAPRAARGGPVATPRWWSRCSY